MRSYRVIPNNLKVVLYTPNEWSSIICRIKIEELARFMSGEQSYKKTEDSIDRRLKEFPRNKR